MTKLIRRAQTKKVMLILLPLLVLLAACNSSPSPTPDPGGTATTIDSIGANPNPSPANVGIQFSWTVFGQNLTCKLDVEGDGKVDYTVERCTSQSRIVHAYGVQGSFDARLTVTGADGLVRQQIVPVRVVAPNTPPTIPSLIPTSSPSSADPLVVQFAWAVADLDADITHCRFDAESDGIWDYDGLCSGLQAISSAGKASSVSFTYQHKYSKNGRYEAILEAADPYASTRSKVPVRVPWNRAPVIDTLKTTVGANDTATVSFVVSDPDEDALECTLKVQSRGTFRYNSCRKMTRTFSFPFPAPGSYGVTLEVTDPYQGKTVKQATLVIRPHPVQAVAGERHSCALISNGDAYCWGDNYRGQLGNPTGAGSFFFLTTIPLKVQGGHVFTTLASYEYHVCGLTLAGKVYCWGLNNYGQLGNSTNAGFNTANPYPLLVEGDNTFTQLVSGAYHICGLTSDGEAYCWGRNNRGQLGNSTGFGKANVGSTTPLPVEGGHTFAKLGAGNVHTCGITRAGAAYCWGSNRYGQLGHPDQAGQGSPGISTPTQVSGTGSYVDLALGEYASCGLSADGSAHCWGTNHSGQLGSDLNIGTYDPNSSPQPVSGSLAFVRLYGGYGGACGITAAGTAYCWGLSTFGRLGNSAVPTNPGSYSSDPVPVDGGYRFAQIHLANYHSCGVTINQQAYCWGINAQGQLATSLNFETENPNPVPQLIPSPWLP